MTFSRSDSSSRFGGVRRPAAPARTIAFACVSMLASYLPFSAVNGALGTIGQATSASTSDLQWFSDAFALALAAVVLPAGVLSERFGRRATTILGLAFTVLGGAVAIVAGPLSGSAAIASVWVAQALAGIGGGAVMSASLGLITSAAPDIATRRRGIALWAAAITGGLGTGPFVAAGVLSLVSWRWMFLPIIVLAGAVGLFGLIAADEHRPDVRRRTDIAGQLLSAAAVCAVIVAVITGGAAEWRGVATWMTGSVALAALIAFLVVEWVQREPMLPLRLFSYRSFTAAGVAAGTMLFSIVGTVFTTSLLLAHGGATDLQIALHLGCMFAANALASVLAAPLQARFGSPRVLLTGLVFAAAGAGSLAVAGTDESFVNTVWRLIIFGFGSGLVMATASAAAVSETPGAMTAMAGAANNALRQVGAALGVAVVGAVLSSRLQDHSYAAAADYCFGLLAIVLLAAAATYTALLFRRHT